MASRRKSLVALVAVAALIFSGCAQNCRINTDPEGADVYVNGILIGETPVLYKYRSGLPRTVYVKIEKDGYDIIKDVTLDSEYRADVSLLLLIPGIIPYFFSARFEEQMVFPMKQRN